MKLPSNLFLKEKMIGDPLATVNLSNSILEDLPAAIYTCDAQGRITYFNPAAAEMWGHKPIIGKDLWCGSAKIFNIDGSPMSVDNYPLVIALKKKIPVYGQEIIIERADGKRMIVLPHPKPTFDIHGKLTGAINMLVDITDKRNNELSLLEDEKRFRSLSVSLEKKVEEKSLAIRESEDRYHKMIDEIKDYAILMLDKEGNVLNWNKGAEKIKGYTEDEIIGKSFKVFYLEEDRRNMLPDKLIRIAETEGRAKHEGWRLRKDGTKFWGSIVITALHDDKEEIIGFSKVTRDLTNKKLAEDKLKKYAESIELQNKQLEEYAYVASHDLQEPLRKIQVFAELLETNVVDKEAVATYSNKIRLAAKRMTALIKDVLKYSQLSRKDELHEKIDLNEILENVKEDFSLIIEEKQAEIKSEILPTIKGIPIQINQLFSNLINNSIKFSNSKPRIEISSDILDKDEIIKYGLEPELTYLKLVFKDNGHGFESEYADKAFKLFQRLNNKDQGTGIGLALCKKVVENHNGHISVESELNKGSIFKVILPIL